MTRNGTLFKAGEYIYTPALTFTRYTVHGLPDFPHGQPWSIVRQGVFDGFTGKPDSVVINQGLVPPDDVYKGHWVDHRRVENRAVIVKGEFFTKAQTSNRFPMFIRSDERETAWLQVKREIGEDFLRRIKQERNPDLYVKRHEIDILAMQEAQKEEGTNRIVGGWFTGLKLNRVSSAWLGGQDVNESDDWERFTEAGDLSSVTMIMEAYGTEIRVILSRRGAIAFQTSKLGPGIALELLDEIYLIIRPFIQINELWWCRTD